LSTVQTGVSKEEQSEKKNCNETEFGMNCNHSCSDMHFAILF